MQVQQLASLRGFNDWQCAVVTDVGIFCTCRGMLFNAGGLALAVTLRHRQLPIHRPIAPEQVPLYRGPKHA